MTARKLLRLIPVVLLFCLLVALSAAAAQPEGPPRAPSVYDQLTSLPLPDPPRPGQVTPPPANDTAEPLSNGMVFNWSRWAISGYGTDLGWEIFTADSGLHLQLRLASSPAAEIHPKADRGFRRVVFASNRDGDFEIYSIAAGIQSIGVYHNDFAALAHENRHVQPGMVYEPYLLGGTSALTNGNLEAGLSGWTTAGSRPPVASADSFRGAPVAAG